MRSDEKYPEEFLGVVPEERQRDENDVGRRGANAAIVHSVKCDEIQ